MLPYRPFLTQSQLSFPYCLYIQYTIFNPHIATFNEIFRYISIKTVIYVAYHIFRLFPLLYTDKKTAKCYISCYIFIEIFIYPDAKKDRTPEEPDPIDAIDAIDAKIPSYSCFSGASCVALPTS